jgi:hypothetical protein
MKFTFLNLIQLGFFLIFNLSREVSNFIVEKKYINIEYDCVLKIYLVEEIITYKRTQFDNSLIQNGKFKTWQIKKLLTNRDKFNSQTFSSLKVENNDSSIKLNNLKYGFRKNFENNDDNNADKIILIEFDLSQDVNFSWKTITLKFSYSLFESDSKINNSKNKISNKLYGISFDISNYNTKSIVECQINIIIKNFLLDVNSIIFDKPYSFGYYDEERYKEIYKSSKLDGKNHIYKAKINQPTTMKIFRIFFIDQISPLKNGIVNIKFKKHIYNDKIFPIKDFNYSKSNATFEEYMDSFLHSNFISITIVIMCAFIFIFALNLIGKTEWSKKISLGNFDITLKY